MQEPITIQVNIDSAIEKVWEFYTQPEHIVKWNNASEDWHTPHAENDLRVGGRFLSRMEAKDGSAGFDFEGTYDAVETYAQLAYTMDDGRQVSVDFISDSEGSENAETKVIVTFDPESTNSLDMQREGWQAILNNFKKYVESES
ncbi:MAG: SRPBCC family protein [Patescibacteria group bacterium]